MSFSVVLNGTTYTEANFEGQAYADENTGLPAALADMVAHVADQLKSTSTSSLLIGTGSKALTLADTGKGFAIGQSVIIAETAAPSTNWMAGVVTAYTPSTGAMTVNVTSTGGSGTIAAWTVSISGLVGATGAAGANGADGAESVPATAAAMFFNSAAPTGWTFSASLNDRVPLVTSTEANGGGTGGSGWTITGLSVGATTLTASQLPALNYSGSKLTYNAFLTGGGSGELIMYGNERLIAGTNKPFYVDVVSNAGGSSHQHTPAHDGAWRPSYVYGIICTKD